MQWRFKKPTYDYLIPKLNKSIDKLNEEETAVYFKWFLEQVPGRVAYISAVCAKELHIRPEQMDCSPESLRLLWKWFRKRARTEKLIPSAIDLENTEKFGNQFLPVRQLTLETEYILRDIGMYVGETFIKNCDNIHWTYYTKPKRDFFVNAPLLQGFIDTSCGKPFHASFEPIHMVRVQASKLLKRRSMDDDLFNLYNFWANMK